MNPQFLVMNDGILGSLLSARCAKPKSQRRREVPPATQRLPFGDPNGGVSIARGGTPKWWVYDVYIWFLGVPPIFWETPLNGSVLPDLSIFLWQWWVAGQFLEGVPSFAKQRSTGIQVLVNVGWLCRTAKSGALEDGEWCRLFRKCGFCWEKIHAFV